MRLYNLVWIVAMALGLVGWGCAGSTEEAVLVKSQPLMVLSPVKGYVKKVAMVQASLPAAVFDRNAADLYFKALAASIRKAGAELQLLTPEDDGFPSFMTTLPRSVRLADAQSLSRTGREKGFNGLITTALHNVQAETFKTGMFWFRKARHRFMFEVTLELLDPITGAKIVSLLKSGSVRISDTAYDDYKAGVLTSEEDLDEALVDLAEEIGEVVAEALEDQPWQVSVVQVDGAQILLPAGRQAGLQAGQRLAVVEGQRTLAGYQGEKFIVPGLKIGEIVISHVSEQAAEATTETLDKIKTGDIAVPIK